MRRRPACVPPPRSRFAGFRFSPDVIMVTVRWYLRYSLSYRDVEELLAERGITVDHVTVFRWVQRCHRTGNTTQHPTRADGRPRRSATVDPGSGRRAPTTSIATSTTTAGRERLRTRGGGVLSIKGHEAWTSGTSPGPFSGSQWFRERWQTGSDGGRRVAEHKIGIDRRLRWRVSRTWRGVRCR